MIELTGYRDKHEYVNKHGVKSVVYLMDCMDAMAQMGDREFGLAVVDPPYGMKKSSTNGAGKLKHRALNRMNTDWDTAPTQSYFDELFRVANNSVIWGGNYFSLPPSRCFLVWDKKQYMPTFSRCEYAWTSFYKPAKIFDFDNASTDKIHPTQKPIDLYDWIFHNYAKPNDTIFDSHLGSGSSRIAADKHNLPFLGTETDADYFRDHCKRFDRYTAQLTLF